MTNLDEFTGSGGYLKREDVPDPVVLTIKSTKFEDFEDDKGGVRRKLIVEWQEDYPSMVFNTTNINNLKLLYGVADTNQLPGLQVEVYDDPTVQFAGKLVGGLRIRKPSTADTPTGVQDGDLIFKRAQEDFPKATTTQQLDLYYKTLDEQANGNDGLKFDLLKIYMEAKTKLEAK